MRNGEGVGKNVKSIFAKSRTEILAILWIFGSFYGIKWLNWMQFSYKSVCPSILIQIQGKISLKIEGHVSKNVSKYSNIRVEYPIMKKSQRRSGLHMHIFQSIFCVQGKL